MALYKTLSINPPVRWMLMTPVTPWEALKMAWYLWRYPDRCAALVGIDEQWLKTNASEAPAQASETEAATDDAVDSHPHDDGLIEPNRSGPLFGPSGGPFLPSGAT